MISTKKTRIATLLLVLVTLFTALFIPINAAEPDASEDKGIEEIMPWQQILTVQYFYRKMYH